MAMPRTAVRGGLPEFGCSPTPDSRNLPEQTQALSLWPHQLAAIAATHGAIKRGKAAGLWSMPTGSGKTVAFVSLARELNQPALILVHRDELVVQTVATLVPLVHRGEVVALVFGYQDWATL